MEIIFCFRDDCARSTWKVRNVNHVFRAKNLRPDLHPCKWNKSTSRDLRRSCSPTRLRRSKILVTLSLRWTGITKSRIKKRPTCGKSSDSRKYVCVRWLLAVYPMFNVKVCEGAALYINYNTSLLFFQVVLNLSVFIDRMWSNVTISLAKSRIWLLGYTFLLLTVKINSFKFCLYCFLVAQCIILKCVKF